MTSICDLPVVGSSSNVSFSPDGTQIAWKDDEGVKVADAPNLAAGSGTCTLTSPAHVISATGKSPDFGGADVGKILNPRGSQGGNPGGPGGPGNPGGGNSATPPSLNLKLSGKATRAGFAKV